MTDRRKLAETLLDIAQQALAEAHARHTVTITELRELRNSIDRLRKYAEEMERESERKAIGMDAIRAMYGSKARSYGDMARKLTLLRYGTEAVGIAEVVPVYGSDAFPYVYHEDHVDGRTLVPEYVARELRRGDR